MYPAPRILIHFIFPTLSLFFSLFPSILRTEPSTLPPFLFFFVLSPQPHSCRRLPLPSFLFPFSFFSLQHLSRSFSLNLSSSFMASHLIPLISFSWPHGVHTWALILLILCNGFSLNPSWSHFCGFCLGSPIRFVSIRWYGVFNSVICGFVLLTVRISEFSVGSLTMGAIGLHCVDLWFFFICYLFIYFLILYVMCCDFYPKFSICNLWICCDFSLKKKIWDVKILGTEENKI